MPKAKKRKDTSFEPTQAKSVFLYGEPNSGKRSLLIKMQEAFCKLVNQDIQALNQMDGYLLQIVKNSKKDSAMRVLEKSMRPDGLNSAFCQAAFDMAVTRLSGRMDSIRLDLYAKEQSIFTQSKVLFAMSMMGRSKQEMSSAMSEIAKGRSGFYADCARELDAMDPADFRFAMLQLRDSYVMASLEYRIPELSRAEMPLDSRLMKIELSENIKAPYVVTITDPFRKNSRFSIPVSTSAHSLHKIRSSQMAGTINVSMDTGKFRVAWAYTRTLERPKTVKTVGLDTGITDLFHSSDNAAYGSLKPAIDFYKQEVEPAFAVLSDLRNKKRAISHFLHTHPGIPADAGRSLIRKMDRLDHMIQTMEAPYQKKRRYYGMLDKAVKDGVDAYIDSIGKDTLTVLEQLDIKEVKPHMSEDTCF